jgi:hypothetical protein
MPAHELTDLMSRLRVEAARAAKANDG